VTLLLPSALCPKHGAPTKRSVCADCNAAYMRNYLRQRRLNEPLKELCARAKKRADKLGLPYLLTPSQLVIPERCPALGIPLRVGGKRSMNSPSLDRICPSEGYVSGNVRVISDHANRLKGARSPRQLLVLSVSGREELRDDYRKLYSYVQRESLLRTARLRSEEARGRRREWRAMVDFLERVCITGKLDEWMPDDDPTRDESGKCAMQFAPH
jgi:hypothetical protein